MITFCDENTRSQFGEWEANTDYQRYLAWLAEGNIPEQENN